VGFFLNGFLERMIQFLVALLQLELRFLHMLAFFHQVAQMVLVLFDRLLVAVAGIC